MTRDEGYPRLDLTGSGGGEGNIKKRPLGIRLLAIAFMLAPLGLVLETIYYYKIPLYNLKLLMIPELWTAQVLIMAILTPLVGLCVWSVHKWGYIALLVYSGLILINNIAVWMSDFAMSGILERLLFSIGYFGILLVEIRKDFYAPYFNPRLRWWEQAHRYTTDRIHIIVKEFGKGEELFQANSFDVSATGVYVATDYAVKIGDVFGMDVLLPGERVHHATGEVVWVHGGDDSNPRGFGFRFTTRSPRFRAEIHSVIRQLHANMKNR